MDLNVLEEVKWEFCIKAITYYKTHKCSLGSACYKYLNELEKDLQQYLKEQE